MNSIIRTKLINKKNVAKKIWLILCCTVLFAGIIGSISTKKDIIRIEKVKEEQQKKEQTFTEEKEKKRGNCPIAQDDELSGVVLLNVGEKDTKNISPEDIHNIICVIFSNNKKYEIIDVVALQKECCIGKSKSNSLMTIKEIFNKDNPQIMYDAIEKTIDYKVDSFIVYNSNTINEIMDMIYFLDLYISKDETKNIDEKVEINQIQKEKLKIHKNRSYKEIEQYNWQRLNPLQVVSYGYLNYDSWDCETNDWKHIYIISQLIAEMRLESYSDLDRIGKILTAGDTDISEKKMISIGAAIKNHKVLFKSRWMWNLEILKYKGKKFAFPSNQVEALNYIHKTLGHEKNYKLSKAAKKYIKTLTNTRAFITEQAEKKAAEKKKKNSENSSNSEGNAYSNNNSSNSSGNKAQKSNNSNSKNNSNKTKKSVNTDPVEPTPPPSPEPEPTPQPDPQPQTEENNSSDVLEE